MQNATAYQAQANMRGLMMMCLAFFLFSTGDTMAKILSMHLHALQIVWARQTGLMLVALLLLARKGPALLRTASPGLQMLRGALAVASAICFITAIAYVPLADAVAVTFIAPFLVTILGALILREQVTLGHWVAIALGFVGVMIVIRPGLGVFHPSIFLVALAAGFFALRQILSRALGATGTTATTLFYTAATSFGLVCLPLPFVWEWPTEPLWILIMIAIGFLAAGGETLVIRAFETAEAVVIAPVHYSLIIWATFYGWLVFEQLPDIWTWVGTGIICATGIYILRQQRPTTRRVGP